MPQCRLSGAQEACSDDSYSRDVPGMVRVFPGNGPGNSRFRKFPINFCVYYSQGHVNDILLKVHLKHMIEVIGSSPFRYFKTSAHPNPFAMWGGPSSEPVPKSEVLKRLGSGREFSGSWRRCSPDTVW